MNLTPAINIFCKPSLAIALLLTTSLGFSDDLSTIYQKSLQSDPVLASAEATYLAELEARPQAKAALRPQISAMAGLNYSFIDPDPKPAGLDSEFLSHSYGINLGQVIYDKQARIRLEQADTSIASAELSLEAARQDLILRVAEAYFAILSARDDLAFSSAEKESFKKLLDQNQQRFEVGLIAITDVHETQARYDISVAQEIASKNQLDITREDLYTLTGQSFTALATLQSETPLNKPQPQQINEWVRTAQQANPEVLRAQVSIQQAEQQTELQSAQKHPRIGLNANHGYGRRYGGLSEGEGFDTTLGLQLSMPIYTSGLINSQVRQAGHRTTVAEQLFDRTVRDTTRQTRASYLNVLSQISQVKALQQALQSTETAAEAAEAGFEVGTRTAVDVLLALTQTYGARRDYYRARYDYLLSTLRLKLSAGSLSDADITAINQWLASSE